MKCKAERAERKPRIVWHEGRKVKCDVCGHHGLIVGVSPRLDSRTDYTCDSCGHYWTSGKGYNEMKENTKI